MEDHLKNENRLSKEWEVREQLLHACVDVKKLFLPELFGVLKDR